MQPVSGYPIVLNTARPESPNRFWAIPLIGLFIKEIILIPHFIILGLLFFVMGLAHLVIWIPVLFMGRYPTWGFALTAGAVRWSARIALYFLGVTNNYPAFSMDAPGDIVIAFPESSSRFWAIPFIGIGIKGLILIPHQLILGVLGFVLGISQLVIWIPVLFGGQYPVWAFQLSSGYTLWTSRVFAYQLGLTDAYPPFSFS